MARANADLVPLADATAGATGALLTTVALMPVDVAKTRMQTGKSKGSAIEVIKQILVENGPAALWKGLHLKGVEVVLRNFLYFYAYEWFKARLRKIGIKASFLGDTLCGVLAGMSNLTVTMPIDTLNVRIQNDSRDAGEIARELLAEGVEGMWSGFGVSSILTLNPALTFAIFDALKARTLRVLGTKKLSAAQAFALGSAAKVIATLVCYPLMRAKSMIQAASTKKPAALAAAPTSLLSPTPTACPESPTRNGTSGAKHGARNGNGAKQHGSEAPKVLASVESPKKGGVPPTTPGGSPSAPRGFVQVLRDILEEEGVAGLYRGCAAQIFTAVAKSGILLTTKEQLAAFAMGLVLFLNGRKRQRLS